MNCFNHSDRPAIGLCKHCSKGLCTECTSDLGHGLACKGAHENQVEDLDMIIRKNTKAVSSAPQNILIAPIFCVFTGLVFAIFGYSKRGLMDFGVILGTGFIVFGIVVFIRNKTIYGKNA